MNLSTYGHSPHLKVHSAMRSKRSAHGVSRHVNLDVSRVILAQKPVNHGFSNGSVDIPSNSLRQQKAAIIPMMMTDEGAFEGARV